MGPLPLVRIPTRDGCSGAIHSRQVLSPQGPGDSRSVFSQASITLPWRLPRIEARIQQNIFHFIYAPFRPFSLNHVDLFPLNALCRKCEKHSPLFDREFSDGG